MQRIRKPLVVLLSLARCAAVLTAGGNDVASTPKVTVEEPSFTAVLPKGYELQEESLNFLDASIPCKLYYYTGENDIFMLMYADYGAMFESLSTETGMDLGPVSYTHLLLPHLQKGFSIALCVEGEAPDSLALARQLQGYERLGQPVNFVIGGSWGLDPRVIAASKARLSLSKLTMPRNLARLVLLEQLYRASKIAAGETYHK